MISGDTFGPLEVIKLDLSGDIPKYVHEKLIELRIPESLLLPKTRIEGDAADWVELFGMPKTDTIEDA